MNPDMPSEQWGGQQALAGVVRQLVVPQGFTLSIAGTLAIQLGHRPHTGPVAIWLFVLGAGVGCCTVVRAVGAHRGQAAAPDAISGYRLFNLAPVVIVPVASLASWWIANPPAGLLISGFVAAAGYVNAVAVFFRLVGRQEPRQLAPDSRERRSTGRAS